MIGSEIVRHRDTYQKLFATMIGYLNMGLGLRTQCSETRAGKTSPNSATRPSSHTAPCAA
jgi:hypothetical protein